MKKGDTFLLCTDGFWEYLIESDMMALLKPGQKPKQWLAQMAAIIEAKGQGEYDNYTALAVLL